MQRNNIQPPPETKGLKGYKNFRKGSLSTPPYGYSVIQGKLVINPQEYETVLTIMDFWKSGKTTYAIAKTLDEKNTPPRRSKKWCRKTISTIIKREKAKELDQNTDSASEM